MAELAPAPPHQPQRLRPIDVAALFGVYVIWGSTYLALRVAVAGFPPFLLAGARFLAAGGALYAFLRLRGAAAPTRAEWRGAAVIGFLLLVVGNGAVTWSEQYVGSGLAALAVASEPAFAALFAHWFGDRATGRDWIGLALGFAGVALLQSGGELRANVGAAVALLAASASWAFGSTVHRRLTLPAGAMATAAEMLTAGAMMSLIGLLRGETVHHADHTWARPLGAWVYLVVFGSLIGFSAYTHLLRHVRPVVATSYAYVNPVIALMLAAALGGETITLRMIAAAGIIVAGVVLITVRRKGG